MEKNRNGSDRNSSDRNSGDRNGSYRSWSDRNGSDGTVATGTVVTRTVVGTGRACSFGADGRTHHAATLVFKVTKSPPLWEPCPARLEDSEQGGDKATVELDSFWRASSAAPSLEFIQRRRASGKQSEHSRPEDVHSHRTQVPLPLHWQHRRPPGQRVRRSLSR